MICGTANGRNHATTALSISIMELHDGYAAVGLQYGVTHPAPCFGLIAAGDFAVDVTKMMDCVTSACLNEHHVRIRLAKFTFDSRNGFTDVDKV